MSYESGIKWSYERTALVLGYFLNPLLVPPLVLIVLLLHIGAEADVILSIVPLSLLIYLGLPGLMLHVLRKANLINSFEIRTRRNRIRPFMGGVLFAFLAVPVLNARAGEASDFVLLVTISFALLMMISTIVTLRIKLSIHVAAFVSLIVFLSWMMHIIPAGENASFRVGPVHILIGVLVTGTVAWGRLKSEAHTGREVQFGIAFGLIATSALLCAGTLFIV